jgi:hypothetical protein
MGMEKETEVKIKKNLGIACKDGGGGEDGDDRGRSEGEDVDKQDGNK